MERMVDHQDQVTALFPVMGHTDEEHWKIFVFLRDMYTFSALTAV
jgi:sulfur relay (sulfurtransferase) DsrC/TusE family protein